MKDIFLYDTHTHTNMEPMMSDLDNIISICKDRKVIWNCVGTCVDDSKIAIEQAKKYKGQIYATIGIHPDNCTNIKDIDELEKLYLENKDVIVAFGEFGLDYFQSDIDHETQKLFFKKQIELANKYDMPICIHVRDAENDCLEILKLVKNPKRVWIHCFAMGVALVNEYVKRGYMISVPGIITFKNAKELQESIKHIPLDRLMVETDGPWLAPVPHRGKTNYPHYVQFVAEDIANKLQMSKEELIKKITENSVNFFRLK